MSTDDRIPVRCHTVDEHHRMAGDPCLCTGQGCPCGMSGAVEGVAHIWWRRDVLGAAGGQQ